MSAVLARPAPSTRGATLRSLALAEARRYARAPVFLVGVALLVWATVTSLGDLDDAGGDLAVVPAACLGLAGVLVGHSLTRSTSRPGDAVRAAPADGVLRTAALALACLVPGAVALAWAVWVALALAAADLPAAIGWARQAGMLATGVVATVGGPLVGVLVGRWTRFPGAGLVAAVVLTGWALACTAGLMMGATRWGTLVHLNAPFTTWTSADGPDAPAWLAGGSPWWYVAYQVALCGLAATAAMAHEATGARRTRLWRVLAVLAVVAVGCLGLASAADPTRVFL
ncbi:hypothetical protein [Geodermatophilus sp. SYSU D01119]